MGETAQDEIPIFPLGTVLFPGGALPLRVFERRYVDMVRECLRESRPFGVCRITRGNEVGVPADHEAVGCTASIVDCDMAQPGVLGVRAVGGQRFRVIDRRIEHDLIRARVEPMAPDRRVAPPPRLAGCVEIVRRIVRELGADPQGPPPILPPYDYESAGWVANRIAELLPVPAQVRQQLMALDDPLVRLERVDEIVRAAGG